MPALFRSERIPLALGAFWTVVTAWMLWNMQARGVNPSTFESDSTVAVSAAPGLTAFTPAVNTAGVGLVFYPGALADPEAYAPMARAVAEAGYAVVVVELPYRLAPFERHGTSSPRGPGPSSWRRPGGGRGSSGATRRAGSSPPSSSGTTGPTPPGCS